MVYSTTTHITINYLPPSATESQGFNHLSSVYLFNVGQACDNNCTAVFDKNFVKIFKSAEVNINALFPPIIQGHRNKPSQPLYSVSLSTYPLSTHKENEIINVLSIQDRIDFYHGALFSPKLSTRCKAIKNGFIQYWPELTVNQVTQYTPISEATVKGHMNSQKSKIRSTKKGPVKKNGHYHTKTHPHSQHFQKQRIIC